MIFGRAIFYPRFPFVHEGVLNAAVLYSIYMKTLIRLFTPSLFAFLLVGASAASSVAPDRTPGGNKATGVSSAEPESMLQWAMSADTVRQIMGQPDKIRPMKAPNGKAEIWVFTRQLNPRVDRVPVTTIPIMTTTNIVIGSSNDKKSGPTLDQKIGETIVYGDLFSATVETVELLMFNEHFVKQKISRQNVRHFN